MPEPKRDLAMVQPYEELFQVAAMTLSTIDPETGPCAAPVYFVVRKQAAADLLWRLYFFSEAASQHAKNLLQDRRAACNCAAWLILCPGATSGSWPGRRTAPNFPSLLNSRP
jgi:hypothetical protein